MTNNQLVIEQNKRLSESILWQLQRDYFEREGVNAWSGYVPYFVTSNTFIANCYANVVVNFFQDCLLKNPEAANHPFYILELGTGSGQLSFYVIKRIQEICAKLDLKHLKFTYVMTDFTESNLQFWQSQPGLKKFLDEGILDFAIYNMEEDHEINLITKGITLSNKTLVNPVVVFANYIFDTISHDCFSIKNKKLHEVTLKVATEEDNVVDGKVVDMERLHIDFDEQEIKSDYYEEEVFNDILDDYKLSLDDAKILLPISSLRSLAKLRSISNDKLLLISSDKGYSALSQLSRLSYPHFSFHGSFSLMVNFHAIGQYFTRTGGDYFIQTPRDGIKTCVFISGLNFADLPATKYAIDHYIEGFSPADYFILHRYISDTFNDAKLDLLVSHLVLTGYDPYMYNRFHERIHLLLENADASVLAHLFNSLPQIASNFYYTPSAHDLLFDLAYVYQTVKKYAEACEYYQRSINIFGKKFGALYNLAISQYYLGNRLESLALFQESQAMNPDEKYAQFIKEWMELLSQDANSQST